MQTAFSFFVLMLLMLCTAYTLAAKSCVNETNTPCPKCFFNTQQALDDCYMRIAIEHGVVTNRPRPFGALIVDTYTNTILCYGRNDPLNTLSHAELAAILNCTFRYPSPTGNDRANPGVFWANATMYTSAESCSMCSYATLFKGVGRVVHGTSVYTLMKLGFAQDSRPQKQAFRDFSHTFLVTGARIPLVGKALEQLADAAFYNGTNRVAPRADTYNNPENVFHEPECGCGAH